jgi:NADH:ubiquinone oxidoreductase subunit F (NADH-binding)
VLPRLLAGCTFARSLGLVEHEAIHGPLRLGGREARGADPLIEELTLAGLCGLGGASFPTAAKLRAVAAQRRRPVIVVNAAEGEPLSAKDRMLVGYLPHLVLDGAVAVAAALGAGEVVVAVDTGSAGIAASIERAIAERPELGRRGVSAVTTVVADGYLSGQDTALLSALEGGSGKPSMTPPYPSQRGLHRRPTFVANAETLAQVALIARYRAGWFRQLGTEHDPGSRLVTVSGAVARPGVIEIACGTPLRALLHAAGGITGPVQAVLLGGYGGVWVGAGAGDLRLGEWALRKRRATLGPGVVFVLGVDSCPVAEVARVTRWLADESAGQCGPCINGLDAIASALEALCHDGDDGGFGRLEHWCALVTGRGACALPDGAARFVRSALGVFPEAFDDHARHGRCELCTASPQLPVGNVGGARHHSDDALDARARPGQRRQGG